MEKSVRCFMYHTYRVFFNVVITEWYLDGGASNRMCLSLLSGIPKDVNWALSRLVNLSDEHNVRFVLATVPKLTDAIFYAPEVYLKSYVRNKNNFCPHPRVELIRKHATESMLVLRNASHNDLNAAHLVQDPRTIGLINDILRLPPDDEANTEIMVYAMELLQVIGNHLPLPSKGRHPYGNIPIEVLEHMLSTSVDRTLIIHSLNVLTLLMTPPTTPPANTEPAYPPPYAPRSDSPVLARVLQLLALVQDHLLLTSSLEFFAAYLTSLSATQAFLLHPSLTKTLRLLVGVLRYEQKTEIQSVRIGPPVRTAEPEAEWLPYELSDEELARIAPMPEPERSFQW
jgi:chromatin structure-remodeling complex subunit RSC9